MQLSPAVGGEATLGLCIVSVMYYSPAADTIIQSRQKKKVNKVLVSLSLIFLPVFFYNNICFLTAKQGTTVKCFVVAVVVFLFRPQIFNRQEEQRRQGFQNRPSQRNHHGSQGLGQGDGRMAQSDRGGHRNV